MNDCIIISPHHSPILPFDEVPSCVPISDDGPVSLLTSIRESVFLEMNVMMYFVNLSPEERKPTFLPQTLLQAPSYLTVFL